MNRFNTLEIRNRKVKIKGKPNSWIWWRNWREKIANTLSDINTGMDDIIKRVEKSGDFRKEDKRFINSLWIKKLEMFISKIEKSISSAKAGFYMFAADAIDERDDEFVRNIAVKKTSLKILLKYVKSVLEKKRFQTVEKNLWNERTNYIMEKINNVDINEKDLEIMISLPSQSLDIIDIRLENKYKEFLDKYNFFTTKDSDTEENKEIRNKIETIKNIRSYIEDYI